MGILASPADGYIYKAYTTRWVTDYLCSAVWATQNRTPRAQNQTSPSAHMGMIITRRGICKYNNHMTILRIFREESS